MVELTWKPGDPLYRRPVLSSFVCDGEPTGAIRRMVDLIPDHRDGCGLCDGSGLTGDAMVVEFGGDS